MLVCAVVFSGRLTAQETPYSAIGAKVQAYPAGIIGQVFLSRSIFSGLIGNIYGAYNLTRRQDFGKHDNEEGGGPGGGISLRYLFNPAGNGFQMGARSDVWLMSIDWEDNQPSRTGSTDITVIQPTLQAGYRWASPGSDWIVDGLLSLGAEINVSSKGEDVGEGVILLIGFSIARKF